MTRSVSATASVASIKSGTEATAGPRLPRVGVCVTPSSTAAPETPRRRLPGTSGRLLGPATRHDRFHPDAISRGPRPAGGLSFETNHDDELIGLDLREVGGPDPVRFECCDQRANRSIPIRGTSAPGSLTRERLSGVRTTGPPWPRRPDRASAVASRVAATPRVSMMRTVPKSDSSSLRCVGASRGRRPARAHAASHAASAISLVGTPSGGPGGVERRPPLGVNRPVWPRSTVIGGLAGSSWGRAARVTGRHARRVRSRRPPACRGSAVGPIRSPSNGATRHARTGLPSRSSRCSVSFLSRMCRRAGGRGSTGARRTARRGKPSCPTCRCCATARRLAVSATRLGCGVQSLPAGVSAARGLERAYIASHATPRRSRAPELPAHGSRLACDTG